MALTINYNQTLVNVGYIYTATSGGTVFSANKASSSVFDYFPNTAVTNDAIYFGKTTSINQCWSDILVNVGTAIAGTGVTGVWEYPNSASTWATIPQLKDDTNGFTTTGANRVRFGFPKNWRQVAVNGVTTTWVRFRLTGGTVSEGGANQTSVVQIGDGRVNVSGTTAGSPATLNDIYTYMNTNYSYVGAVKNNNYYDFRWFSVSFDSPTLSTNEVLETGFDMTGASNVRGNWNFDYWTTGSLVGTNHGKRGSKIIINGITNSYPLTFTTNQKSYGASYFSNPNFNAGYPNLGGTFYDCNLQIAPGAVGIGDVSNCTFELGFPFIAASWATVAQNPFLNNTFIVTGQGGWGVYMASFTITKPNIIFDTGTKYLLTSQQNNVGGLIWNFVDPINPLPTNSTTNKPMLNARGTDGNIQNVFYYDDSAGTYTDYTTQASDATADDVPLPVDVGDCLYLNIQNAVTSLNHPSITMTNQENNNTYIWEYYKTSAFKSFTNMWDETVNFTKTGVVWHERGVGDITSTTINGVTGYWYRLRLVTKGSTTNTASMIKRRYRAGTADWKLNYQNSITYTAKDGSSNLLDGVNVTYTDKYGTAQFSGTTSSGVITPANVTTNQYYFDPLDATRDTSNDTVEKLYNPFSKRVRKYGYWFQDTSVTISAPQIPVDILTVNPYVVASQAVAHAYTGISITGNTITVNADHTMQELYDWCEDWATLNMSKSEPYTTSDGTNFFSTFDLVLDGCALTGDATISMAVNSVTYLNGATSTVTIVAVDGTHTNIKLTGLVSGSRVQLYDIDNIDEMYNDIVSGTTLTLPAIWNVDRDIRIRVMYVNGATAKKWYETTATLTSTGINLAINQEDDNVYNDIGIDGSTVTECSITGTNLIIDVDDPDNTTTVQRPYAYEVYWLFTEDGIRDQQLYIEATDMTHFTYTGGLKLKNNKTTPLRLTGGIVVPDVGDPTDVFDLTGGPIFNNYDSVVGFPYSTTTNNYSNTLVGVEL